MQDEIRRLIQESKLENGFTPTEVKTALSSDKKAGDIKKSLAELKRSGLLVSSGQNYYLASYRPDLLPTRDSAKKLSENVENYKIENRNSYPPSLNDFFNWVSTKLEIPPSRFQEWLKKGKSKVALVQHPEKGEVVVIQKEDIGSLVTSDLTMNLLQKHLNKAKQNSTVYPTPLSDLKKNVTEDLSHMLSNYKVPASQVEKQILGALYGISIIGKGSARKLVFTEDLPSLSNVLTPVYLKQFTMNFLQSRMRKKSFKYPCTDTEWANALASTIKNEYPMLQTKATELKPYLNQCDDSVKLIKSGKSQKICFTGHEMLIQTPKGDELKELLFELIQWRESNKPNRERIEPNIENLFWDIHKQLDERGLQDRAVPIPKLWGALKDQMSRKQFESLLQSLADRNDIQLERRTTMEGLTEQEINDCYHVNDRIFYTARRLR